MAVALLVFGPSKVAELGGTLGRAVHDFRDATEGKPHAAARTEARSCPSCRATVAADARFCAHCGASVVPALPGGSA